jgi:hypothetical protein
LFAKAEREGAAYKGAQATTNLAGATDAFFNFAVTMHSLVDWVRRTRPALSKQVFAMLGREPALQTCQALANGAKHFEVDFSRDEYQSHIDLAEEVVPSGGMNIKIAVIDERPADAPPASGGFHLKTVYESHRRVRATEVIESALRAWCDFLRQHNL